MYAGMGLLLAAIAAEVAASAALPRTHGFKDPAWSVAVLAGYALSIWLLALVVRVVPVSTAYAIWAGLGTAAVAVVGVVWLDESVTSVKVAALLMIIAGVVMLNLQGAH
jgi:small multidrug resistance pump